MSATRGFHAETRLSVALVVPLPPTESGIADYVADLLPHLRARCDVTAVIADDAPAPSIDVRYARVSDVRQSRSIRALPRSAATVPFYHLGNHRLHAAALSLLVRWPGVVALHDAHLHHIYADILLARGRLAAYVREVARDAGVAGARRAELAAMGIDAPDWLGTPMLRAVVQRATAIVVHSQAAARLVLAVEPRARVAVVHHGVGDPDQTGIDRDAARVSLGLARDRFVVGSFGGLTPEKRLGTVIAAFAGLLAERPDALLILAGDVSPALDLASPRRRHGVPESAVRVTGRLDLAVLERHMAACDVAIQLRRAPSFGEASGATLRLLRLGRPTIVSDHGWFAELPAGAVERIPSSDEAVEAAAVAARLIGLAADPARRAALGAAARAATRTMSWSLAADRYLDLLRASVAPGAAQMAAASSA